jgi:hypothetical protein
VFSNGINFVGTSSTGNSVDTSGISSSAASGVPASYNSSPITTWSFGTGNRLINIAPALYDLVTPPTTVGALGTCNGASAGKIKIVTDANSPAWGASLSGGGSATALAFCNGSSWTASAK